MLSPEELDGLSPEVRAKVEELNNQMAEKERQNQRLAIEKEAAENLLSSTELRGPLRRGVSAIEQNPRDATGMINFESMVKDASSVEVDSAAFSNEVDAAAKEILSRFSDEQMNEPATIKAAIHMFGKTIGELAFKRAFQHSVNVFQKAVNMKANIDGMIAQWRLDNPDLANDKQSEDLVEFFLMKRVIVNPLNKNKQLPELLELATGMAREYLETAEKKGRETGRRESTETVVPLTLRPSGPGNTRGNGVTRKATTEEPELTNEQAAERFLAMRQKMSAQKAWGGRPS